MNRSTLFKLMHKFNKYIIFINKHFYIISFSAWIFNQFSLLKNNKLIFTFIKLIKILLIVAIVLSVGIIAYFTDFTTPLYNTFSIYNDLIEPYIEIIKHLYTKVIDYFNNIISLTQQTKGLDKDTILNQLNIENEIKSGIKSGIKEALEEVIDDLEAESNKIKSDYLIKQIIIASSVLFTVYLFLYLPGSDITTTDINQYNSFNQLLINLKLSIIDIFSKPTPPTSPGSGTNNIANISPVINSITPPQVSPIPSPTTSESLFRTITPNTPNISNVQTLSEYVENSAVTNLDGITLSRILYNTGVLRESIDSETANMLKELAEEKIVKITDG